MNLLILLYLLLIAPKILFDRVMRGKRHPGFLQRLGFQIPHTTKPVIWIHAVSVGEVKAAQPLFKQLKQNHPHAFFLLTTTTATGQAEAKRSIPRADAFAYLPLDLTWVVRKWVRTLNPRHFILVESDFWPNLLYALNKNGTQIDLVSGKLSARSAKRFQTLSHFSRKLFSRFDHICVQNQDHFNHFKPLVDPSRLHVTGNLKLDLQPQPITQTLALPQPAITLSCTHANEEELLLDLLQDYFLILAPRHPERFNEIAQLLTRKNIPFTRFSHPQPLKKVLLIDTMGQLPICYAHSSLAIVGGSYVDHIGGHNVLEPLLYGTPVFFGPHTFGQKEFVAKALESGAGKCIPLTDLQQAIAQFFAHPDQQNQMRIAAHTLIQSNRGATTKTLTVIGKSCV